MNLDIKNLFLKTKKEQIKKTFQRKGFLKKVIKVNIKDHRIMNFLQEVKVGLIKKTLLKKNQITFLALELLEKEESNI